MAQPEFGDRSRTFADLEDVIHAFEDKRLGLHDWVWVRFNGEVEDNDELDEPDQERRPSAMAHASSSGPSAVIALTRTAL